MMRQAMTRLMAMARRRRSAVSWASAFDAAAGLQHPVPVLDAPAQAVPAQALDRRLRATRAGAWSAGTTPPARSPAAGAPPPHGSPRGRSAPCPGGTAGAGAARPGSAPRAWPCAPRRWGRACCLPASAGRSGAGPGPAPAPATGAWRTAANSLQGSPLRVRSCLARTSRSTRGWRRCSSNSSKKSASRSMTPSSRVCGISAASCHAVAVRLNPAEGLLLLDRDRGGGAVVLGRLGGGRGALRRAAPRGAGPRS